MTQQPRSVLVTGGAGYVGSHACKALAGAGYLPITFDNLSTGHAESVKWGPLHVADIRDAGRLSAVLAESDAVAVMHFAASAYVGESVADPQKYYRNNVAGTIAVLDAMRASDVGTLVFSSSCATYGAAADPIGEDALQRPINPYGRSKLMCEEIIRDVAGAHRVGFAILRYFNAAGADPAGELAERHFPETHLVPSLLMAALGVGPQVEVFGDAYPTPDGTCVRDYVHVSDLADGHVLALEHLLNGGGALALNLGTGQGHSVREVIRACEECVGQAIPYCVGAERSGDPPSLVADPRRAREMLGFTAPRSNLRQIVDDACSALRALSEQASAPG